MSGSSAGTEAETTRTSNVRRENKLYSYKEQMADMELRRVRTVLDLPLCLYWVTETNVSNLSQRPKVSSET